MTAATLDLAKAIILEDAQRLRGEKKIDSRLSNTRAQPEFCMVFPLSSRRDECLAPLRRFIL